MNERLKMKSAKGEIYFIYDFKGLDYCEACGQNASAYAQRPQPRFCPECPEMPYIAHLHLKCACEFKWLELTKTGAELIRIQMTRDVAALRDAKTPDGIDPQGFYGTTGPA